MDPFEDHYFRLQRKLMTCIGIWHGQTNRQRLLRTGIVGSTLLCSVPVQICQFFSLSYNLRSTALMLKIFVSSLCTLTIYSTILIHFGAVRKVFHCIRQDWQRLKNDDELKIMQKYAYITKLFTLFCTVAYCGDVIFLTCPSILRKILSTNEETNSLYRFPIVSCTDYFIDREKYYYAIVVHQLVLFIVASLISITCYSMYFLIIQHVCANLSIIKSKTNVPFRDDRTKNNVLIIRMDVSHWLIDIIKHLTRTNEFLKVINKVGEQIYLLHVLLASLLLITDFISLLEIPRLAEHQTILNDVVIAITFFGITTSIIYATCYVGQTVMDYSADVYKEMSLIPIYDMSLDTQKLLLTMLILNAKPCSLSIGKLYVSSHEFFIDLIRMSLSFAMVLHSTQKT